MYVVRKHVYRRLHVGLAKLETIILKNTLGQLSEGV